MAKRKYNPWQQSQPFLIAAAVIFLAGVWFGFPGPALYIAVALIFKAWPKEDEFEFESPPAEKAKKAAAYKRHLFNPFGSPFGTKLGAGPAGQHSSQPGGFWPATRVSTWAALPVVWFCIMLFSALPTAIPFLDAAFIFLLWQALAAGAREAVHPSEGEGFPAAMLEREVITRTSTIIMVAYGVIGAAAGAAAGWYGTEQIDQLIGSSEWPFIVKLSFTVIMGIAGAVAGTARPYITEYVRPTKEHLEKAEAWQMRWLSIPKLGVMPPMFASEHPQPPEGAPPKPNGEPAEETHRVAYFQVPAGATIESYRQKTLELTSAIAQTPGEAEYVLLSPMNKTNDFGQPIPGTRQEALFGLYWNTVPLPNDAHLTTGFDNWTTKFVIHRAFDRAFVSLKLGMPDLVRPLPLHDMSTPNVLWETIWQLSPDVTFDKIISKSDQIAEKIGADWLRVGRHTKDSSGGSIPESHVSIVFGSHPDHVKLQNKGLRAWLDSLELESAFHALRLGSPVLENTKQLSVPGNPSLVEAQFRLDNKVSWSDVIRKTSALEEKLRVDYLRMTRRNVGTKDNPSPVISVIYGAHPDETVLIGDPPDYDPDEIREGDEKSKLRLFLDGVEWDSWFRACKIIGSNGVSPTPLTKYVNSQGVATYKMRSVPGLSVEDIEDELDTLMATSGMGYIEVENDPDARYFKLLAAKIDPLDKPYLAVDYADEPKPGTDLPVFHAPIYGKPDVDWVVGPGADGTLLVDKWAGDNPHLFVGGASGSGKALALNTLIPIPTGWAKLGDLKVGDQVLDDDGLPCYITWVSPVWHGRPVYEVEFDDGEVIVADAEHDWMAENLSGGHAVSSQSWGADGANLLRSYKNGTGRHVTIRELSEEIGGCETTLRNVLGDADKYDHDVSLETLAVHVETESFVYNRKRQNLTGSLLVTTAEMAASLSEGWSVAQTEPLSLPVRELPVEPYLLGKKLGREHQGSMTFFIPDVYLRSSQEQRYAVLQGLMETDGSVNEDGHAEFTSTSYRLVEGVVELARSLGSKAAMREHTDEKGATYWQSTWTNERVGRRYITDIRPVESVPVRCIEVDSKSHMFLAGESMVPTSNSVAILSMILQMLHNNDPRDVKFALADPKTELQYFATAQHVNFFIGLTTPGFGENPRRALADLLSEMRDETYRRNTLFSQHPKMPQNLQQARFIARKEVQNAKHGEVPDDWPDGLSFPWWDGTPEEHPFMLPFQFIVIEECSSFFATPARKDHRPDWEEVIGFVEELARISRSAGIHLIAATQYPKKENIPTTLLAQCRRIGLPMNRVGSMLTIEEAGLEKLSTPGRGMMSHGKGYRGVRCLFVRVPDDKNPDMPDDRADIYSKVVKKADMAPIDTESEIPPSMVEHGPTFTSKPPPSPDGIWIPRSGGKQQARSSESLPDLFTDLAELEQVVSEPSDDSGQVDTKEVLDELLEKTETEDVTDMMPSSVPPPEDFFSDEEPSVEPDVTTEDSSVADEHEDEDDFPDLDDLLK